MGAQDGIPLKQMALFKKYTFLRKCLCERRQLQLHFEAKIMVVGL